MSENDDQIARFKEVVRLQKKLQIAKNYETKTEKVFKTILTETFPNFEKDLVSKFSFDNESSKEAFLTVCPQLESGNSFERYVKKISKAMEDIEETEIEIDNEMKNIAIYNESPWLWFRRPMPPKIKDLCKDYE